MIKVTYVRSCDNCGGEVQDINEILCRKCKPSLAKKAEIQECRDKINEAYWYFCRCANAKPPAMVVPEAYIRLKELLNSEV